MGILTVSGAPGTPAEATARLTAQLLGAEFVGDVRLEAALMEEFGGVPSDDRAWPPAVSAVLLRLATEHHLVVAFPGCDHLFPDLGRVVRCHLNARETYRIGSLMLSEHVDRTSARTRLGELESAMKLGLRRRFGRQRTAEPHLVLNAEMLSTDQMSELAASLWRTSGVNEQGLLPFSEEAQLQFAMRLQLARFGVHPVGRAQWKKRSFSHPSEETFANLLDFYRIPWEYEPRSFPLETDANGKPTVLFTPDFYLPEFDLYIELTTMKQSLVTKKNRKVRRLKELYPEINIQVFYQKDFQNLIFKYGLADRPTVNAE